MKHEDDNAIDPRVHDFLDGEVSTSEAAAFEVDLRPGSTSENQVRTFRHLGTWFRSTRPRAPSSLARSVEAALEAEIAVQERAESAIPGWWKRVIPRGGLRWAWIPAATAAIVLLTIIMADRVPDPGVDIPQSTERIVSPVSGDGITVIQDDGGHTVQYVFTLKATDAGRVCLAGDFNEWKVCEAPMEHVGGDTWSITIELPRGRHEYMFVIDDQWVTDPNAMGYSDDGFGNRNAVLVV
jgi:hypothetical protein